MGRDDADRRPRPCDAIYFVHGPGRLTDMFQDVRHLDVFELEVVEGIGVIVQVVDQVHVGRIVDIHANGTFKFPERPAAQIKFGRHVHPFPCLLRRMPERATWYGQPAAVSSELDRFDPGSDPGYFASFTGVWTFE